MPGLIPKSDFIGIEDVAHLAAGGETPVLASNGMAVQRFFLDKGIGQPGRARLYAVADKARERLGRLMNCAPSEIALLWNGTAGLHTVVSSIDWRPGDNVVVGASEFQSLVHMWQGAGLNTRRVGNTPCVTLDEISEAVTDRTRVIVVSHVSYLTGDRCDLAALREIADRVGARLIVDASHSLGVVPVDGSICDAVVSCCYKWLLGTHGVGVFYVNSRRWPDIRPMAVGWNSVVPEPDFRQRGEYVLKQTMEKFEGGNPSFISAYILENATGVIETTGVPAIEQYVLDLGGELRESLGDFGLDILTPRDRSSRAGNISFATNDYLRIELALREQGILVWGSDNRVRISVHAYNDERDIERALKGLKNLVR